MTVHKGKMSKRKMEKYIAQVRYPDADLKLLAKRYKEKLETAITLQNKGYRLKNYLKSLGILRPFMSDVQYTRFIEPWMTKGEQVTQSMTDKLVGKFLKSSPEVRFRGYLNRDIAVLKKNGHEDLIESVTALKVIRFVKKQLEKNIEQLKEENSEAESADIDTSPEILSDSTAVKADSDS
jgi:hypothetical protein